MPPLPLILLSRAASSLTCQLTGLRGCPREWEGPISHVRLRKSEKINPPHSDEFPLGRVRRLPHGMVSEVGGVVLPQLNPKKAPFQFKLNTFTP